MTSDHTTLLIGNHVVFMEFVALWLRRDPQIRIIGIARRVAEAVALARECPAVHLVIVDADAAGNCCKAFADALRVPHPHCRILFLSGLGDDATITAALEAQAAGLVFKDDLPDTISTAVQEILNGGTWFPESIRARLVIDSLGIRLMPMTTHEEPRESGKPA